MGSIFGGCVFHSMTSHRQIGDWFAHAATGFAVTDVHGNVVDANDALARIVDRTPAEISTANLFEFTHPEDQARHRSLLDQLLASQIPGFVIEKRYLRRDGSPVWVRNSVSLVSDDQNKSHLISICEDISQHKRAEQALEKQEQMAAIGRLTSSIIHEINNPLEAVLNLLFLAQNAVDLEEAMPYLRDAEEELTRASEITAQGLQFHRQSSYPASINVIYIMQSVLALFKEKLRMARVEVVLETQDAPGASVLRWGVAPGICEPHRKCGGSHQRWRPDHDPCQARHRLADRGSRRSHHDCRHRFRHQPRNPEAHV